jgi:signal transduction histidine kinase
MGRGGFQPYELPDHNHDKTIVFKVQYVPGSDALVTVWLDPVLTHGATAENQPENLTTKFKANACFDEIRLRHDGGGNGWIFSDMAVATSFNDFVIVHFWQTWWFNALMVVVLFALMVFAVRVVEKRKFQFALARMERQHALEQERARIAQDLHDELGSQLTRISLLGGLLQADKQNPAQVESHAAKIAHSADQTVRALEEIVWAVRPGSDTLPSLVDYIAHFANELFENNPLRCRLDLPGDLPARYLPPDVRHNLFLITKEALNNVLKHSGGTEVRVQVRVDADRLEISVSDNGKGFNPEAESASRRNGLGNMRRRAEAVHATLTLTSRPGGGTQVAVICRFPA